LKLDFSTILLVIAAVIPGLFAQRTRNQLVPRSFAPQGATSELAELVALGLSTHGILAFVAAIVFLLCGWLRHGNGDYYSSLVDSLIATQWYSRNVIEAWLIASAYGFLSFFFSHWLGFIYGLWRSRSPLTTRLFANATWLRRFGITGLLGEQPIIYGVLNPEPDGGTTKSVFVEVQMKDGLGFYSGQLSQFAIVKDDEPHKPIYLIDVWYKKERTANYELLQTDGLMLDLADAAPLLVKQVDVTLNLTPPSPAHRPAPSHDQIAQRAQELWAERGYRDGCAEQDWSDAKRELS
jgi:Family of unknown function (DUF6338)/Protein of unknown function (DUF2934)